MDIQSYPKLTEMEAADALGILFIFIACEGYCATLPHSTFRRNILDGQNGLVV